MKINVLALGFLLFLVFFILKVTGTVAWSWWWITAPLWVPFALGLGILAFGLLFLFAAAVIAILAD